MSGSTAVVTVCMTRRDKRISEWQMPPTPRENREERQISTNRAMMILFACCRAQEQRRWVENSCRFRFQAGWRNPETALVVSWRSDEKNATYARACRPFSSVFYVGPRLPRLVEEA